MVTKMETLFSSLRQAARESENEDTSREMLGMNEREGGQGREGHLWARGRV